MVEENQLARFEQAVLPHLDAAYNLARWLTRNDHDAEDLVQAAYLRALRFFGGYSMANNRAWLLTIVRNTCYSWLRQNRAHEFTVPLEEELDRLMQEADDGDERQRRQLAAVRFYLQEVVATITHVWQKDFQGVTNYSILADRLEKWSAAKKELGSRAWWRS